MPRSAQPPPAITNLSEALPDAPASSLAWSRSATLLFAGLLIGLLAVGLWTWLAPVDHPSGLPDDPDVRSARELASGGLPVASRLTLITSLAGESQWCPPESLPIGRLAACHERIARAAERRPDDVRLAATLAHLELAGLRLDDAILHYRDAIDRSPRYGEARLGLGVALAAVSANLVDPDRRRVVDLEALGQFANVDRVDPVYEAALANRVALLTRVGRPAEASRLLRRELATRPDDAWARRYRELLAGL